MPIAHANGVDLYYEEAGQGFPLVWSHEFGGDYRSWEPQIRHFARGYRVIVYNHRGYPPSEVPKEAERYSQDALVEDLHGLLRFLGIRQAHVGGCSMGANVALNFGLAHPEMARSLIVVGGGAGSVDRDVFLARQAPPPTRSSARVWGRWSGISPRPRPDGPSARRIRGAGTSSSATSASTRRRPARP